MNGDLGDQPKSLLLCRKLVIRKEVLNMGLISEWVEVILNSANIKYYENLGYEIPRKPNQWGRIGVPVGTAIVVKTTDLPKHSHVKVDVQCDCCKKIRNICYATYVNKCRDDKTYCQKCATKLFNSGENHPNWNPNITDEERQIGRNYPEYKDFIKRVLARDNYTCQVCGQEHGDIQVHHLDSYDWCKEKRTDDTNGVCLCGECHKAFHADCGAGNNTKEQFENWLGKTIELLSYNGTITSTKRIYNFEDDVIYPNLYICASELQAAPTNVYKCCERYVQTKIYKRNNGVETTYTTTTNSVKGKHLFWLNEYEKMTKEEIMSVINFKKNRYRKVICISTNEIFDNFADASKKYKCSQATIRKVCLGKNKRGYNIFNNKKYKWMYYDDFLKLPQNKQDELLKENNIDLDDNKSIA